ncbi:MAG TPA: TonB-dependent receptor, partial [Solimonas sp.]
LYASYAQIFQSQAGEVDTSLKPLKPVEGNTYELGAKGSWYEGALTASLALYQVDRKNERQQVSTLPQFPNCCYVAVGEIQSRGIETELTGELMPGWQLSFGYTFNRNKYKSGYGADDGVASAPDTPKHLLKLWTMAQLRGSWSDVRVGGGVNWQSDVYVRGTALTFNPGSGQYDGPEIPYQYTQDAYAVVSLRGEYRLNPQWSVALNVNNALDETYYQTVAGSTGGNYYGEPRHWQMSVQGRW